RTAAEAGAARTSGEPFVTVASTLSFGPRIAQERLGVRVVTTHLSPFLMRSRFAPPILPGLDLPAWLPARAVHAIQRNVDRFVVDPARLPPLNAVRAEFGLRPIARLTDWLPSPDGLLLMVPPWFAPPQVDWPAQTVQANFPRADRFGDEPELSGGLRAFLDGGPPPIAVTCGSSMRHGLPFFTAMAEACVRIGRRALLVSARPEQVPPILPPGVLHVPYAPFGQLLPLCAGLVHHGGIGTTAEALAAGIPQFVVPNAFDQFDNAARLVRLGVGRRLDRAYVTAERAAATLDALLNDPAIAAACALARARMEAEDGIAAACDAIEAAALRP
ncbi:glycosyltransferase, partial [Methylobacterium trifolii]